MSSQSPTPPFFTVGVPTRPFGEQLSSSSPVTSPTVRPARLNRPTAAHDIKSDPFAIDTPGENSLRLPALRQIHHESELEAEDARSIQHLDMDEVREREANILQAGALVSQVPAFCCCIAVPNDQWMNLLRKSPSNK